MKLSRIVTGLLSVALLAFMVTDTLGQDGGRRGGRGGGPGGGPGGGFQGRGGGPGGPGRGGPGGGRGDLMSLVRMDEVKLELQISPKQEEGLDKLAEQLASERRAPRAEGGRPNFQDMSEEEQRKFIEERQKEQAEQTAKMREQLEEVLLPAQMTRLDQISLQVRGVQALSEERVAKELEITKEQQEKLAAKRDEVQSTMRERMRELFASGDREKMREAFGNMRKEIEDDILSVLSSDQRKEFEEMKGEPFEMPDRGFGRGGPGGGRGGPGGGRGGPGGGRGFGGPGGGGDGGDGGGRRRRSRPETEE